MDSRRSPDNFIYTDYDAVRQISNSSGFTFQFNSYDTKLPSPVINITLLNSKRIRYDTVPIVKGTFDCIPTSTGHGEGGGNHNGNGGGMGEGIYFKGSVGNSVWGRINPSGASAPETYRVSSRGSWIDVERLTNDPLASYNVSVDCGDARTHVIGVNSLGNMTCPGDSRGYLSYECPSRRKDQYVHIGTANLMFKILHVTCIIMMSGQLPVYAINHHYYMVIFLALVII